jgi:hypothetical protein
MPKTITTICKALFGCKCHIDVEFEEKVRIIFTACDGIGQVVYGVANENAPHETC